MAGRVWNKIYTAFALVIAFGCGARAYAETTSDGGFFLWLGLGAFLMHGALGGLKEFLRD